MKIGSDGRKNHFTTFMVVKLFEMPYFMRDVEQLSIKRKQLCPSLKGSESLRENPNFLKQNILDEFERSA